MKKIISLVWVQLLAMLSDTFTFKKRANTKALYTGLVFIFLLFSGLAFFYWMMIGSALKMFNSVDLLPVMVMAMTCFIVLITTINKVKGTIFNFKDYDMVMSLPIKTSGIVASRVALLYFLNMFFVLILTIPMILAYGILARPEIAFYFYSILLVFFIPLIPIMIASVIGTAIAYVASKFRYSNFVNIVITLLFFLGIMALSITMDENGAELADMSKLLLERVYRIYPLASYFYLATADYNVSALLLYIVISAVAFWLYNYVIGKVFKRLNSSIMEKKARANYQMKELKKESPFKALYRKEIGRYFASTIYVLNTSIGVIMLIIGTIALFFIDLETVVGEPQAIELLNKIGPVVISFFSILSCTTMASISIEGKNFWILKSLPVAPKKIFDAKIGLNVTVIAPAIICSLILSFVLKTDVLQGFYMIMIPILVMFFTSIYGLIVNLMLPNFKWTSEAMVVKQSASVLIVTFTGFLVVGLPMLCLALFPFLDFSYILGAYGLLMLITDIVLYRILITWGTKRFMELG